jgi:hypothetical protein
MSTKVNKTCSECYNSIGRFNKYFDKYICKDCRILDNYTLITKTNAKNEYFFKDDELQTIKSFAGTSSHGPATYFIKSDLLNLAYNKYNTDSTNLSNILQEIIDNKQQKKINNLNNKKIKEDKRKIKLINALKKSGLKLREDSKFCQLYINGKTKESLEDIVDRMCQMKYLYEYCHMDECKHIAYKEQQEELEAGYFPDCSISDQAEYIALKKYSNGKYPVIFPWLTN